MLVSASVWTLSSTSINGNDLKHDIVEFNSNDALVNNLVPLIEDHQDHNSINEVHYIISNQHKYFIIINNEIGILLKYVEYLTQHNHSKWFSIKSN